MTDPTERQLRELFAADATRAPDPGGLAALTLHRVRHRRRRVRAAAGLVAAAVVVGGVVWSPLGSSSSPAAAPTGVGALPGDAAADCQGYSIVGLAAHLDREGAFAFDGTVTGIEPGADLGPEMPRQDLTVTFRVGTWFQGGSGDTVDVYLYDPGWDLDSDVAALGVGTRLLMSGVFADIAGVSGALDASEDTAYFGASCGYTRYYDESTAAEWAAVVAGDLPAGALPATRAASCSEYAPALIGQRDFSLDGTVTDIGEQRFPLLPGETESDGYFAVTFDVHTWYRGGEGGTVTLHMENDPYLSTPQGSAETYGVGTRLLVSGDVSDVEGRGPIAQGCGFTRYYDEQTAAEWAAATD